MPTNPIAAETVVASLTKSFAAAKRHETPYRHWFIENCLPPEAIQSADKLPFPAPLMPRTVLSSRSWPPSLTRCRTPA
jgi:hypothetical protein